MWLATPKQDGAELGTHLHPLSLCRLLCFLFLPVHLLVIVIDALLLLVGGLAKLFLLELEGVDQSSEVGLSLPPTQRTLNPSARLTELKHTTHLGAVKELGAALQEAEDGVEELHLSPVLLAHGREGVVILGSHRHAERERWQEMSWQSLKNTPIRFTTTIQWYKYRGTPRSESPIFHYNVFDPVQNFAF